MPATEVPEQSYYPSARVRLIVRFEDFGASGTPEPPPTPPQLRRGITDKGSAPDLRVENQNGVLLLLGPGDSANQLGSPQQQRASQDQLTQVVDGIIPITASWSQNSIRTADTLSLSIEFADFPIDPRTIRSCAVQFFLGTVSPEDFQRGVNGDLRTQGIPPGANIRYNVIPDEYIDSQGRSRSNLRFQGWVDDFNAEWPDGDAPVISLECTDNTRLLIEQEHPSRLAVSVEQPIDRAIADYLANFPQFRGLSVEFQPPGTTPPTLKVALTKQAYPPGVGPSTSKSGDNKLSVWDYLTDVTKSLALSVRFDGTRIIIQSARALYNRRFPPRFDDPFQGRDLQRLGPIVTRHMIYGQNIASMTWSRQLSKYAPVNVEVRSYNPRRKKTLIARFPQKDSRNKRITPGEKADTKFEVVSVAGIQDEAVLRAVAQQLYEQLARNELGVTVMTQNLGSYGGGNLDPDLLDAKVGDSVTIVVDRDPPQDRTLNTVTSIESELSTRPYEFLRELRFPDGFAKAYAAAVNHMGLPSTFRMKEIHVDWDKAAGCRIDFDAVNYIEVRADAELPAGEEAQPPPDEPASSTTVGSRP